MKSTQQQIEEYTNWREECKERGYQWNLHRYEIANQLIKKFNYTRYLEIGVHDGTNFRNIKIKHKDGVDPGREIRNPSEVNYPITSDEFFEYIKDKNIKYDIIFVDGLHFDEQVYKDICNSLNHLTENGTVLCHDINPQWEIVQRKQRANINCWNGDCWKAWVQLRSELKNYSMEVVDTDYGVGIIRPGSQQLLTLPEFGFDLEYDYLEANRTNALNLISIEDFYLKYD